MTYRIRYRDKRRPFLGECLVRLTAANQRRAAAAARAMLEARGVHPVILGVAQAD